MSAYSNDGIKIFLIIPVLPVPEVPYNSVP